ncbi:MAG: hypothetical protein MRY63_06460 [Neomegalonema sp.]|nr:hypothetical protein [Neomegalonema sp.]
MIETRIAALQSGIPPQDRAAAQDCALTARETPKPAQSGGDLPDPAFSPATELVLVKELAPLLRAYLALVPSLRLAMRTRATGEEKTQSQQDTIDLDAARDEITRRLARIQEQGDAAQMARSAQ